MFRSFFPNPRPFFWSMSIWSLVSVLVWFFAARDWGQYIGLENPAEGTPPIDWAIRVYLEAICLVLHLLRLNRSDFCGNLVEISPHPWFKWSVLGGALIVFYTYFNVQLSVAINAWYGPFYDLLKKALSIAMPAARMPPRKS